MRFKTIQPDNPILRLEINQQQRTIPRWLQWFDRFGVILVALVISFALLIAPIRDDSYGSGMTFPYPPIKFLPAILSLLWIVQLMVILRCLLAGTNAMRRYRDWQQSNPLAVAEMGATRRQIIVGKFWSVLYQLRGWVIAFGIIKLAVFGFLILYLVISYYRYPFDNVIYNRGYYLRGNFSLIEVVLQKVEATDIQKLMPAIDHIAVAVVLIIVSSLLEIMASSALGMLGGLIPKKVIGLGTAFVLRFATVIIFVFFPDYPNADIGFMWRWFQYTWFSFADGGSSGILRAGLVYIGIDPIMPRTLMAFWAAIVMYIAYLIFAYLVSNFLLLRQGFLSASSK